jgi:phosphoribosyl 1,2-cyclic phosphodiesterase
MTKGELSVWPLASGSNGNAILIWRGEHAVLVDDGISTRRLTRHLAEVGLGLQNLEAIFLTHEHSDHIGGLPVLRKRCRARIIGSRGTLANLLFRGGEAITPGKAVDVGPFAVEAFDIPHDAEEPVGYVFDVGGMRVATATDVGHVTPDVQEAFSGADIAVIESNHDVEMLFTGPYPKFLKERIRGPTGHLSNDEGAELAVHAAREGARRIVLAHLSECNNLPELAYAAAAIALKREGQRAKVTVAPRGRPGERIDL